MQVKPILSAICRHIWNGWYAAGTGWHAREGFDSRF